MDEERMQHFMMRNFHDLEVSMENALAVINSAVPELRVSALSLTRHSTPHTFFSIYLHTNDMYAEVFRSMTDLNNWLMKKRLLLRQFNLED